MPILTELFPEELHALLLADGFSADEARRLYVHRVRHRRADWDVPHVARRKLDRARARLDEPRLEVIDRRASDDGFLKYLFRLHDGALVEAVRIPVYEKYTVCVSSQVGCALGCVFCATGKLGFWRQLAVWEIVEQLLVVREEADRAVRGVVFMGMGEPFLNYDAVIRAARLFSHPAGVAIAGPAITVSTAGIVPAIRRYTDEGWPFRLSISLSAATAEKRLGLMPIEKAYPLDEVVAAAREHAERRRTRITLAYVALGGVNTAPDDARALVELLRGIPLRLNLIEVNDATGAFRPPSADEMARFRAELAALGQPIVRRTAGGREVRAACGMLAATGARP